MRSLLRVPLRGPRLRVRFAVAAVGLGAAAAAVLAEQPQAAPATVTQQLTIVTDLSSGQPAPTVVTPPPVGGTPIRSPRTAPAPGGGS